MQSAESTDVVCIISSFEGGVMPPLFFYLRFTIHLQNIKQYCNLVTYVVLYNIGGEGTKI